MRTALTHAAAIGIVMAGGLLIGTSFLPGAWYASLAKPVFTPPDWAFGPIWTVLYVLIGWAGARVWLSGDRVGRGLWAGQMGLNWLWSPSFFGLQNPALGLAVILAMLAVILAFIAWNRGRDRLAAALFLPYAAWVTLASAVNAGVVWLN
jgi:tryptophan-rich sensory protein